MVGVIHREVRVHPDADLQPFTPLGGQGLDALQLPEAVRYQDGPVHGGGNVRIGLARGGVEDLLLFHSEGGADLHLPQ